MPNEPQPTPEVSLTEPTVAPPSPAKLALIAPWWHTLLNTALIRGNSFLGTTKLEHVDSGPGSRLCLYGGTFLTEFVLILIIWFGIRSRGVRMRDLIGGRWETVEDFLLDIGIAVGFLIVSLLLLFGLRIALGLIDLHNLQQSQSDTLRVLGPLAPHTYIEAAFFVALSVSAGLFEEIIFRGYLQRQSHALANNAALGIILSAIIFGLGHGYQGARNMVVIAVFGMFFGCMAYLRKSLRPGMIAHGLQDSLAGIALFFLVRHH